MNRWMWMISNETDIVMTPWFLVGHTAPAGRMQRGEFWVLIYLLLLKLLFYLRLHSVERSPPTWCHPHPEWTSSIH